MVSFSEKTDITFMKEALSQAKKGLGRTSPNPAVGAVIVRDGRVIARGYHKKAGCPHAEVEVLKKLGGQAEGDTLYVTLEPCNHFGKTPPCTEAILKSGLKRVVVGMRDPNPRVKGGGCDYLQSKGVLVETGVLEAECAGINEAFLKFVVSGRPFVMVKSALTLDGWTATATGHSQWITNERSRQYVHRLRDQADAVMVGVGTVLADDPSLTTRLARGAGRDPLRVVVDTHLRTPLNARIVTQESVAGTVIATGPQVREEELDKFHKRNVTTVRSPLREGKIDLSALMDILGKMNVTSLFVEGGASLVGSMFRERLIDKFFVFKAPKILGGGNGIPMMAGPGPGKMDECLALKDIKVKRFGEDILIEGYPDY